MTALETRLRAHVAALAAAPRVPGTPEHTRARAYIEGQLRSFGYETFVDCFLGAFNVHARAAGRRFIVGAHYDSVIGSPGADDNASGVAAMLEVARAARNQPFPAPVEFVAYDQEENGLTGSRAHCVRLMREQTDVAGMMSLEMLGFTAKHQVFVRGVETSRTEGDFLAVVANHESAHLLEMFDELETAPPLELIVAAADSEAGALASLSDHGSFWDAGYPALIVTDTAFLRNPHYHRASDRPETLNYEFLALSTEAVISALRCVPLHRDGSIAGC
jgi:Zn-dependent M28 family amino/carboxypeptidase